MEYSFPRYLLAKQSVDNRALNKDVLNALRLNLPPQPYRIIEIGAGIGTMLKRLIDWGLIQQAEYVWVDDSAENAEFASVWIPQWAEKAGLGVIREGKKRFRVFDDSHDVDVRLERTDIFDFIQTNRDPATLLIAHAFLDLLPMPESLPQIMRLTNNLAWLTINFDGVTIFEPTIDMELDGQIERLYHDSMDRRATGGDSKSGRHLFKLLEYAGAGILAAGSSDWMVYGTNGKYPHDEAYFLHFILHFIEETLKDLPEMDADKFSDWLRQRRAQIESGELCYIAHQVDFLARV